MSGATSPAYAQGGGGPGAGSRGVGQQDRHVIQMIANASLDIIEDVIQKDGNMYGRKNPILRMDECAYNPHDITRYLKGVDKFNEWTISAFVTPGSALIGSSAVSVG